MSTNLDRRIVFGEITEGAFERIAPGYFPAPIVREHAARYEWAAQYAVNKLVLDVGCGTTYGCEILRRRGARWVAGADVALPALAFGQASFGIPVVCANALRLPFPAELFDLVTCFEVIEHLAEQAPLLSEMHRVLKTEGLLILSTPNRLRTSGRNPYHVRELSLAEMQSLLEGTNFACVACVGQHWAPVSGLPRKVRGIRRLTYSLENLPHIYRAPSFLLSPSVHIVAAQKKRETQIG